MGPQLPSSTPLAKTYSTMSFKSVIVLLVGLMVSGINGYNSDLCVVETPLTTPYIQPQRVITTPCQGCYNPTSSPNPREVHVIESRNVGGVIEVVIEAEGGLGEVVIALLGGDARSGYKVRFPGTGGDGEGVFVIVVTQNTPIQVQDMNHKYKIVRQSPILPLTREKIVQHTEKEYGSIMSYTRSKQANKVTLRTGGSVDGSVGSICSNVSWHEEVQSSFVRCEVVKDIEVSGCFHANMLGKTDRDIHIVDITPLNTSQHIELIGGDLGSKRNVTLVLRSAHTTTTTTTTTATTWYLHTTNLEGIVTLVVTGSDQVENTSQPGRNEPAGKKQDTPTTDGAKDGVKIQVRRVKLPSSFDQLILSVLTNVGPPVSYTRANGSTHITINVEKRTHGNHITHSAHLTEYKVPNREPGAVIRSGLSVTCDSKAMTLALPYAAAERVGGVAMALLDRACVGSRNGTHIVLRAPYGECRFTRTYVAGRDVYTNLLSVELGPPAVSDDEDLVGSGYGPSDYYPPGLPSLRVQCDTKHIPAAALPPAKPPSVNKTSDAVKGASYSLTLYSDPSLSHRLSSAQSLVSPITVNLNSELYVKAALGSVLPWTEDDATATTTTTTTTTTTAATNLRVVLEECWISNTTSTTTTPATSTAATHLLLLRKSCGVDQSVTIKHNLSPSFSFKVVPEFAILSNFYLHCRVGICYQDALPRPAVTRCSEPTLYCKNKPSLLKLYDSQPTSTSIQTLSIGPITTASTTKSALQGGTTHTHTTISSFGIKKERVPDSATEDKEKTQIVVIKGLSTEIVIGIALASFIIGVCLTGTLWIIHMKTDPGRQKRSNSSAPRNSGYDLSAHSGSSTPSSQAPMTA